MDGLDLCPYKINTFYTMMVSTLRYKCITCQWQLLKIIDQYNLSQFIPYLFIFLATKHHVNIRENVVYDTDIQFFSVYGNS